MKKILKPILITIVILVIYHFGGYIKVIGLDYSVLFSLQKQVSIRDFDSRLSIFALGLIPYVSAHIITLLLTAIIPYFGRLKRDTSAGIKKLNRIIIYITLIIGLIQSYFLSLWILKLNTSEGFTLVTLSPYVFQFLTTLAITLGVFITIWLGWIITRYGVGNGISLIVLLAIISNFSKGLSNVREYCFSEGNQQPFLLVIFAFLILFFIIRYILQHKIKIEFLYSGIDRTKPVSVSIPFNQTGILPLYFADAIWLFPATLGSLQTKGMTSIFDKIINLSQQGSLLTYGIYAVLVIFFTFFYTAIVSNPLEWSNKMKSLNVAIPKIDVGRPTAKYLDRIMARPTIMWGLFLFATATFLNWLPYWFKVPNLNLDGMSLILMVGIVIGVWQSFIDKTSNLKEVFSHTGFYEILLVKGYLEKEDIKVVIDDLESYGRQLHIPFGYLGKKRLLVEEKDFKQAINLIASV